MVFYPQLPRPAEEVDTITVRLFNLPPHYMHCPTNNVTASVDPGAWASINIF
jgi:hypothetical protein